MEKKLNIKSTDFQGLFVIEPNSFCDDRGVFSRIFCESELEDIFKYNIKQINHSVTKKSGTVRGLHFQYEPNSEIKMVKCIKGSVYDVLVDIRKDSETFLKIFYIELSEQNNKMIFVPKGFAHGFQTLTNDTELLYFHSSCYTPSNEGALNAMDKMLNIKWPKDLSYLSERDKNHPFLTNTFKGI
jgi:dTDP-4-dehydrorhamnose 3,5-epimerase